MQRKNSRKKNALDLLFWRTPKKTLKTLWTVYYQRVLKSQITDASSIFLLYFEGKHRTNVHRNPEEHRDGPHCTENSTAMPGTATCRAKLPPPMQTSGQQHELQSAAEQWCWEQHTHPTQTKWRQPILTIYTASKRRAKKAPFGSWLYTHGNGTELGQNTAARSQMAPCELRVLLP